MRKVKVITETTADLPGELTDSRSIEVIPLHILLGEKSSPDDGSVKSEELFEYVEKTGKMPGVVLVTRGQYEKVFEKWLNEDYDILFTGMSNSRSEITVQNAVAAAIVVTAAAKLDRERISVVDSLSYSCGTGLLALEAAELAGNGAGLKEVTEHVLALRSKVHASFVIETVKYYSMLELGSKFLKMVGNALEVKPVLEMKSGTLVDVANLTGKDYINKYFERVMKDAEHIDPKRIFIAHCLVPDAAEGLKEKLGREYGFENVTITNVSPANARNNGPGTIGMFFLNK